METVTLTQDEMSALEKLNEKSEQLIRESYLTAALHGPRWIIGLDGETA